MTREQYMYIPEMDQLINIVIGRHTYSNPDGENVVCNGTRKKPTREMIAFIDRIPVFKCPGSCGKSLHLSVNRSSIYSWSDKPLGH